MIVLRLDIHLLVVSTLQLDGPGGAVAGLVPAAEPGCQMGLHVKGMWYAGRRLDVFFRVQPAERGTMEFLIEVQQFVVGARMKRADANECLVVGNGRDFPAKES